MFGWYAPTAPGEPQTYAAYFRDADFQVSYVEEVGQDFEYLDLSRYSAAKFVLDAIQLFFEDCVKKPDPKDQVAPQHFRLNALNVKVVQHLQMFLGYFPEYHTTLTRLSGNLYRVDIQANKTLAEFLHFLRVMSVFVALKNDEMIDTEGTTEKYLKSILAIDAPYFVRYLFKAHFLRNAKAFEPHQQALQSSATCLELKLTPGTNYHARMFSVKKAFGDTLFGVPLVDLGCGEGAYLKELKYNKKFPESEYHAIDNDPSALFQVRRYAEVKELENVFCFESWAAFQESAPQRFDVLCTEVLEHMPREDSFDLLTQVLAEPRVRQIILTMPNREFNVHYVGMEDTRHHDHDWEPTSQEFQEFVLSAACSGWKVSFDPVGDQVGGISTCLLARLERVSG